MARLKSPKLWLGTIVILGLMVASRIYLPVPLPHIQLPPEVIPGLHVGPLPITNTMIAILLTDLVLVLVAVAVTRKLEMVPSGLQNFVEAVIEFWEQQATQMVGEKLGRQYLPLILTIFAIVWVANWSELVPGYDSVGVAVPAHHEEEAAGDAGDHAEEGAQEHTLFEVDGHIGPLAAVGGRLDDADDPEHAEAAAFVPFLRVASSDLNFTLALALIAVTVIQLAGFRELGVGYMGKFFNFKEGLLGIFVGILELVSEVSRIISFAFRLFGNLFAGQVLLFVIPFLIPLAAVIPIYGLELFVGLIQAYVFAILTLAFISQAIVAHDHH